MVLVPSTFDGEACNDLVGLVFLSLSNGISSRAETNGREALIEETYLVQSLITECNIRSVEDVECGLDYPVPRNQWVEHTEFPKMP
jgi:hypothetical protein